MGAEPQCPEVVDWRSCQAGYGDGMLSLALSASSPSSEETSVLCRPEAQAHVRTCQHSCALRLVVTSPAEYAFAGCLQDNTFQPYVRGGHLDEAHPLRRRELPLVFIDGGGCDPASWSAERHAGKIAVVDAADGICAYSNRAALAGAVHAAACIFIHYNDDLVSLASAVLEGDSAGVSLPALVLSLQHAEMAREAASKGLPVSGYLDLACNVVPVPPPALPVTDNCPTLSLLGKCSNEADPEHRLCNRCPQQLSWGGESVCLWGNGLLPRDGRNHLKSVLVLPANVTAVYIESPTRVGCSPEEFKGLAGTIVFAEDTQRSLRDSCSHFLVARNAAAEGVLAFVSMSGRQKTRDVVGPSQFVAIPVHTTLSTDYDKLRAMFHAGTVEAHLHGQSRYMLRNARLTDEAVADPYRSSNATEAPSAQLVLATTLSAFDATPGVIVSFVLIALLFPLIVCMLRRQYSQAVVLPFASLRTTFTVPLSVASMGLSISLVLTIASVTFTLVYAAGRSATDSALGHGQDATMRTYHDSKENAQEQAQQLMKLVTGRVVTELRAHIDTGERGARETAVAYRDSDTSWASWNSKYQAFIDLTFAYCCDGITDYSGEWKKGWALSMLSVKGFHADLLCKTDDRPDEVRNDGVAHVSVTQDASLYGLAINFGKGPLGRHIPFFSLFDADLPDDPSKRIGQWPAPPGAKHAVVAGQTSGHSTWLLLRDSAPFSEIDTYWYPPDPLSVLMPVYSRGGTYLGVVEAMIDTTVFAELLENALSGDAMLGNVTIVVFEKETGILFIDTNRHASRVLDMYYALGKYVPHRQFIKLEEAIAVESSVLAHYLKTIPDMEGSHTGVFQQAQLYVHSDQRVFDVRASAGGVADVSGSRYGVESLGGGCGSCTASRTLWDGRTGEVLVFDGANSMLIYQNLTTDVPHVAATRRGSGAWDSTVPLYKAVRSLAGVGGGADQQCVVRADLFTPAVECMLRGHYFDKPYALFARFKPSADVSEGDRSQQIFTEATVGETSVRMYANGAVVLNALAYGCGTKPVVGGTKGGEWVSIVFVRTATNCTTFVNGTLWDTKLIMSGYKSEPHGVPFEVGLGFVGEISSLQMLNVTVNEEEAAGLHRTDVFARDVPRRTWLLEMAAIRREDVLHTGLDWIVATMMPRADVMRRVDAKNRATLHNLAVQEDNTNAKLQRATTEIVVVTVAVAHLAVFVFLVFNDLLTRPFAQVCVVMAKAAVMRTEEIPDVSSGIREINAIYRAMVLMMRNLKEYKAYMPQSVVLADADPGCDSASSADDVESKSLTSQGSSTLEREVSNAPVGTNLVITRRTCTFVILNLVEFHSKTAVMSDKKAVSVHGKIAESVLQAVQLAKGICDGFSGDRFLLSFNGPKSLASHRVAGCSAAVTLREALESEHEFEMSSAVVCGQARVGNMGCDLMRKYTFVSPVLSWAYALERYGRSLSCSIVSDHFTVDDVASEFVARLVGQVVFEKRLVGKPVTVSCLLDKRQAGANQEWMYALADLEEADPQASWNKFAKAVFDGNWEVWVSHTLGSETTSLHRKRRSARRRRLPATRHVSA